MRNTCEVFQWALGRILNIESQEMKFHEWGLGVDPDESCWVESVKFNLSFLVVIRVFFEIGPPTCEEIGNHHHHYLFLYTCTCNSLGYYLYALTLFLSLLSFFDLFYIPWAVIFIGRFIIFIPGVIININ